MDPDIERKFNDLISVLKSIEGKVGLPPAPAVNNNLVISPVDTARETETAKIWYRAFEDSPSFGFMKPLTTFLTGTFQDSLFQTFQKVFSGSAAASFTPPPIPGLPLADASFTPSPIPGLPLADFLELQVDTISGISEALVDLGQAVSTAAVGFLLFSLVSWDGVAKGVGAITLLMMSLGVAAAILPDTENIGEIIESISFSLAASAVGFILFSLVQYESIGKGLLFITGMIFLLNRLAPAAENSLETAEIITAIGTTLLVSAAAFLLFNVVNWGSVFKGIFVLASIVFAVAGLSKIVDDTLSGAEAVEMVGKTLLMSSVAFLIFSMVNWEKALAGLGVLTAIIVGVAFISILDSDVRKGAAAVQFVGIGLLASSVAFLIFSMVNWEKAWDGIKVLAAIVGAVVVLGQLKGPLIEGALAIGILSLALLPLSVAMLIFDTIDAAALGKLAGSLAIVGVAAAIFGAGAAIITIGAGVLLVLGASLLLFGLAMRSFTGDEAVWEKLPIAGENISIFLGQLGLSFFSAVAAAAAAPFLLIVGLALIPFASVIKEFTRADVDWTKVYMAGRGIGSLLRAIAFTATAAVGAAAVAGLLKFIMGSIAEVVPLMLDISSVEINILNISRFGLGILTLLGDLGDTLYAAIAASAAVIFIRGSITDIVGIVQSLATISDIETSKIAGKGRDIASFINLFVSELKLSTIFFIGVLSSTLPKFASGILSMATGLNVLRTLDTDNYGTIGEGIAEFFNSLGDIDSDSLEPITEVGKSLPVIGEMISTLTILSTKGLGNISNLNLQPLISSAAAFASALKPVANTIRDVNEAIDQFSFIKLTALASGLSKLTVSVSQASNDMSKTNEILQQSLSVQRLQLEELKAQTNVLSNLSPQSPVIQQSTGSGARSSSTIMTPRDSFESSPYFVRPTR